MSATASTTPGPPAEVCGYTVVEALAQEGCYLAIGPGGRGVVLKRLIDECLLGGALHPSVRERLSRVRELAHAGVANLHGVGVDGGHAYLIWEYVEGRPYDEHARSACGSARELAVLAREAILTLESLHAQGIVHGAVCGGNLIVAPGGAVRLTQISPLLYTDPADDVEALVLLLERTLDGRGGEADPMRRLLREARAARMPLRPLAVRLAAQLESRDPAAPAAGAARRRRGAGTGPRRRALLGALIVALGGVAVAYGVWHAAGEPGLRLPAWLTRGDPAG